VHELTDQQLAAALRTNDEGAFDFIFRSWYAPLVRYATGMTDGDTDEAEDLVQQVFVKFWEQRSTVEIQYSIKAYLYRMVHNRALNRLRSARTRERYIEYQGRQMEYVNEPPIDSQDNELQERYQQALHQLPPQCRKIFELSRFEALKYREIADHLGISIKTVETQMGKALKILRQELIEYLVVLACWMINY
jgi:RNA polymerase sigma-70 factor, ECF subfamily